MKANWQKLHEEACARNEREYIDPESGYTVFTRLEHLARGECCESGCRHCPYGFNAEERSHRKTDKEN